MVIFTRESVEGKCSPGAAQAPPCPPLCPTRCWVTGLPHPHLPLLLLPLGRPGEPPRKQQLKVNKQKPSWLAGVYLLTAMRGQLHSGHLDCVWNVLFWSWASSSCCAFKSRSDLHRIYGWILYRFNTIAWGFYYLLENVNKPQVLQMHFNPWSDFLSRTHELLIVVIVVIAAHTYLTGHCED